MPMWRNGRILTLSLHLNASGMNTSPITASSNDQCAAVVSHACDTYPELQFDRDRFPCPVEHKLLPFWMGI